MSENVVLYVRTAFRKWEELEVSVQGWKESVRLADDETFKSVGFLEVYKSLGDFKATYPNEDPIIMEMLPMEKKSYKEWDSKQKKKEKKEK